MHTVSLRVPSAPYSSSVFFCCRVKHFQQFHFVSFMGSFVLPIQFYPLPQGFQNASLIHQSLYLSCIILLRRFYTNLKRVYFQYLFFLYTKSFLKCMHFVYYVSLRELLIKDCWCSLSEGGKITFNQLALVSEQAFWTS